MICVSSFQRDEADTVPVAGDLGAMAKDRKRASRKSLDRDADVAANLSPIDTTQLCSI